ncbi:immunoglobulin heavy chain [Labeo rohita]|nr:immunoglobulin heavy chain [Labeo rohita]
MTKYLSIQSTEAQSAKHRFAFKDYWYRLQTALTAVFTSVQQVAVSLHEAELCIGSDRERVILTDLKRLRLPASSPPLAGHVTCQNQTGSCHQPLTDGQKPSVFIHKPNLIDKDRVSLVCEVTSSKLGNVYIMWKVGDEPYIEGTTSAPIHQNNYTSVLSFLTMSEEKVHNVIIDTKKWFDGEMVTCTICDTNNDRDVKHEIRFKKGDEPPEPENGFALDCNKVVLEEDEFRSLWSTATSFIFIFLFSLTYSAVLSFCEK